MLPASPGEHNPKSQIIASLPASGHSRSMEDDESLIYQLMHKREQKQSNKALKPQPNKGKHSQREDMGDDSSEYGELLQVNELFVKDEQLNRQVIKNCHQHIEQDNRIKVFIDPNPHPPSRKQTPNKNNSKAVAQNTVQVRKQAIEIRKIPIQAQMIKVQEEGEYDTVKQDAARNRPSRQRKNSSKDLRIRQLVKLKQNRQQEVPKTTRKQINRQSQQSSHRRGSVRTSSQEEMDSYEQFKEYKRRKQAKGVKSLIKKVDYLQRQVQVLRSEKQELQKMKIISKDISGRKQYGIASNLISIKVDSDNLKEDILSELKKIKQKVDHLDRRQDQQRYESLSPGHMTESKMEHTNLILSQARDRTKTGKIFKKSEVKPPNEVQEAAYKQEKQLANELLLDKDQRIQNISEIAEPAKPRNAISISKEMQQRKHQQQTINNKHQQQIIKNKQNYNDLQVLQDKKAVSQFDDVSKSSLNPLGLPRASSECQQSQNTYIKKEKVYQDNRQRRKQLQHKQVSPSGSPPQKNHKQTRGFIRSGIKINSFPHDKPREEEDLRMLQFDTGKQKFIVDSRNTDQDIRVSKRGGKQVSSFQEACNLIPVLPQITRFPTYDTSEQQLVQMGKELFNIFGVARINDDQTVLKVKKYKNCTYFGIDSENNILLHYQGRVYFGGWREFMNGQGEKSGEGVEYQSGKFIYKGQFRDGKRSGAGVLKVFNSSQKASVYVGQFVDGVKHGEGRQFDENGVSYCGQWKQGRKDGFGKLVLGQRQYYQGTFEKGLKHGHGSQIFKNGDKYQGSYIGGKFQGRGRYSWSNGSVYEGEFKNGMRNGKGIWRSAGTNGDIYQGQYQDDLKHGYGVYHWANGSSYEGHFLRDQKHGKGILTHQNGKVSKLQWQNGNVVGKNQQAHSHSVLSSTNIRNHSRSLPVSKHIYAQKQSEKHKHIPIPIVNNQMLHNLKTSSASSLPKGAGSNRHQDAHQEQRSRNGPKPESFMKLYEMSERPMTSKSVSSISGNNFKIQRKSLGRDGQSNGLPKDPPYKGIRPSTNMINF